MTTLDIPHLRLYNQQIAGTKCHTPGEVVAWLGAVQAQDYLGSLWAIGLRTPNANEDDIEQAIVDRTIVRTWPMRGTLHFVAAADVRWLLNLLTPRTVAGSAGRFRQLELDDIVFERSKELFIGALQGGKQLSRGAMYELLESANISTSGQRGIHILWRLAQEGIICFGARAGKQQTFVLLNEWAPEAKPMERAEALAELTKRYFTSHGPATIQDFVWWSGLPTADARSGLEMVKTQLAHEILNDHTYWLAQNTPVAKDISPTAYLLPAFDEYLVGYKDRGAVLDPLYRKQANAGGGMLNPTILIDGQIVGAWKRKLKKDTVVIKTSLFTTLSEAETSILATVANRYGTFLNMSAVLA